MQTNNDRSCARALGYRMPRWHNHVARTTRSMASRSWVAVGVWLALISVVTHGILPDFRCTKEVGPVAASTKGTACRRRSEPADDEVAGADTGILAASYSRFSSDMQRDGSITDQQRDCQALAKANGHRMPADLEFSDAAVSGTKLHRDGLDALMAAAQAGRFQVLYFYNLSRLARESVITMPTLKTLVYNYGIRVISTSEGLDSERQGWELMATVLAIVAEQYIKDLAKSVFRGQEGAVLAGYAVGDHCFGYTSVPIPGSEVVRRGRDPKPRKTYVIDPDAAVWVAQIFDWFVRERRTLRWIARELNCQGAPKDHRASSPRWGHQHIRRVLSNRKYVGDWQWGLQKNVRDPNTGIVSQRSRTPEECEAWRRHLPELALVDQESFDLAQQYLQANRETHAGPRRRNGQLIGSVSGAGRKSPRHLLSGVVECGHCGATLVVGGTQGKYLYCPGWQRGTCSCKTQLNRQLAEELILAEVHRRVLADTAWTQAVLVEATATFEHDQNRVPAELAAAEKSLADVTRRIVKLVDAIEVGQADPDISSRLAQRRQEKRDLESRVEQLSRKQELGLPRPDPAQVTQQLSRLGKVLAGDAPAAALALQQLLSGPIVVMEVRRDGRQRHYLRGKLRIALPGVLKQVTGQTANVSEANGSLPDLVDEIVIDFVRLTTLDSLSEQAKELFDQKLMMVDIARQLNVSRSMATKLIQHWFTSRELAVPDGRSRRAALPQKHLEPPLYQQIAEEVMRLFQNGALYGEIATALGVDRNTVTATIKNWHESRNLPAPDGRTRRRSLDRKVASAE